MEKERAMRKFLTILSITCLFTLSACTSGISVSPTPVDTSGITGYVTQGPTCPGPVRIGDTECQDKPYQATVNVLDTTGNQVVQFQTDVNGYFKIPLAPGEYILHPVSSALFPRAAEQTVIVEPYQYIQLSIMYDTGMR